MVEEAPSIASRIRVKSSAHRFHERLAGARLGSAQQRLNLGERFFYGVEIGRVGRQVEQLAASLLDDLAYPLSLVGREVVHHHHLPRKGYTAEEVSRAYPEFAAGRFLGPTWNLAP